MIADLPVETDKPASQREGYSDEGRSTPSPPPQRKGSQEQEPPPSRQERESPPPTPPRPREGSQEHESPPPPRPPLTREERELEQAERDYQKVKKEYPAEWVRSIEDLAYKRLGTTREEVQEKEDWLYQQQQQQQQQRKRSQGELERIVVRRLVLVSNGK